MSVVAGGRLLLVSGGVSVSGSGSGRRRELASTEILELGARKEEEDRRGEASRFHPGPTMPRTEVRTAAAATLTTRKIARTDVHS